MERTSLNDKNNGNRWTQLLDVPLQSGFDSKKNLLGQPLPWNNRNLDRDTHTHTHTHTVYHMKTKKHVYTWISNTVYIYIKGWIDPSTGHHDKYHQFSSKSHQSPLSTVEGWGTYLKLKVISIISASVWRNLPSKKDYLEIHHSSGTIR